MIKNIKILICIFIAFILIPSTSYATKLTTPDEVVDYYFNELGQNLENAGIEDLENCYNILIKSEQNTQRTMIKDKIKKEIYKRNPDNVKTPEDIMVYWQYPPNNKNLSEEKLKEWINILESQKDKTTENMTKTASAIKNQLDLIKGIDADNWAESIVIKTDTNKKIYGITGKIVGTLQVIGSVIAVAALAIIGIKYMVGSVEEKAKYKETMWPYIIGCIMIFGISNVASIIYKFALNLS